MSEKQKEGHAQTRGIPANTASSLSEEKGKGEKGVELVAKN